MLQVPTILIHFNIDAKLPLSGFLAFWIAVLIWALYFIFANGKLYVQWPRLVPLEFAPDFPRLKGDKIAALEKGEPRRKSEVSVPPPAGVRGYLGTLLGRYAPGYGGGEEFELTGAGKDRRAHAE